MIHTGRPNVNLLSAGEFGSREPQTGLKDPPLPRPEPDLVAPGLPIRRLRQRGFELRHQHIELGRNGTDGIGLTEIDPGSFQQIHRIPAPAGT